MNNAMHKNIATHRRRRNAPRRIDRPFDAPAAARPPWGRILAEFGVLVGWVALWALNGAATAAGFAAVGAFLRSRGQATALVATDWLIIGGVFHVLISAIEQHLWRTAYDRPEGVAERVKAFFAHADPLRLGFAVVVGAVDSFSTAYYARRVVWSLVDQPLWGYNVVVALLAGAIALSAEPMVVNFARKLRDLLREGRG